MIKRTFHDFLLQTSLAQPKIFFFFYVLRFCIATILNNRSRSLSSINLTASEWGGFNAKLVPRSLFSKSCDDRLSRCELVIFTLNHF